MSDILITGCSQLLTLRGAAPRRGRSLRDLGIIQDGALLLQDGMILAAGPRRTIEKRKESRRAKKIDVGGRVVMPGFVDSHTHLVFAESRAAEYEQRIAGATYEQIAKSGGGILSSVRKLRAASAADLKSRAIRASAISPLTAPPHWKQKPATASISPAKSKRSK